MSPRPAVAAGGRLLVMVAALSGLAAVALAALGAHAVSLTDETALRAWSSASLMHLVHSAALLAVAALALRLPGSGVIRSGWLMAGGMLFFCGSLYLRAVGVDILPPWFAPLGGVLMMLAWAWLALAAWRAAA